MFFFDRWGTGDSRPRTGYADIIMDWNARYDAINFGIAANSYNYAEARTSAGSISSALAHAERIFHNEKINVFLYNPARDVGFVFSDQNENGRYEIGIIVKGAGSARDMGFLDIV